jgi:hypothetical protein
MQRRKRLEEIKEIEQKHPMSVTDFDHHVALLRSRPPEAEVYILRN